jgi:uncharacterized protein YndB with AHSA1/START domain
MTKNTVNETERMVVTRVFDAPRELVWKAWTDPKYVMQWWGPKGFTAPFCKMDFRVGGKFLCCMRAPDGQEFWNGGEYHEIVLHEKIVSSMYFSDPEGNKVEPAQYGIEHEAIEGAYDVTTFEDLETARRNSPSLEMKPWRAQRTAVRLEGWNQILDKICRSCCGAGAGEIRS